MFSAEQREEIQAQIDAIVAKIDARVQALQTQLAAADKTKSTQDLMKVEQEIDALAALLKGTDQEAKTAALLAGLARVRERHAAALEAMAQEYMDRAQEHRSKGQFLVARIYVENVLRQFPRTQVAQRAAAQLEQVKNELAADEEKRAWLAAKLTDGENFVKNKLPERAKASYQEILAKYPDSPEAAEAKKRLAALEAPPQE